MPASMISADTGGSAYVAGSSIAMVATGPMPGSTPISVPSTQPMKAYSRFSGVTATPKPIARLWKRSMACLSADERRPDLELQLEQHDERQKTAERQHGAEDQHFLEPEFVTAHRGYDREAVDREDHAHGRHADAGQAAEQHAEQQVRADDEGQGAPGPGPDPIAALRLDDQRLEEHEGTQRREQQAEHQREVARAHARALADRVRGRA